MFGVSCDPEVNRAIVAFESLVWECEEQMKPLRRLKAQRAQSDAARTKYERARDKLTAKAAEALQWVFLIDRREVGASYALMALKLAMETLRFDKNNVALLTQRGYLHLSRGCLGSFVRDVGRVHDRALLDDLARKFCYRHAKRASDPVRLLAVDAFWRVVEKAAADGGEAPWPAPRCDTLSCCVGTDVFFFGGRDFTSAGKPFVRGDMWRFDTVSRTWTEIAYEGDKVPPPRSGGVLVHDDGFFYLYGGCDGAFEPSRMLADVWVAKAPPAGTAAVKWKRISDGKGSLAGARRGFAATVRKGWLYVFSGFRQTSSPDMVRLQLTPDAPAHWEAVRQTGTIPSEREQMVHYIDESGCWVVTGGEVRKPQMMMMAGEMVPYRWMEMFTFDFKTAAWAWCKMPMMLDMESMSTGKYGASPYYRSEVAVASISIAEDSRFTAAFFGGWCSGSHQPRRLGPKGDIHVHEGSFYDLLLMHERDEPNRFKVVVPGPSSSRDAPPSAAGCSCALVQDRVYVFFGRQAWYDQGPPSLPPPPGYPVTHVALDTVHVCTPAEQVLHAKNGADAAAPKLSDDADLMRGYAVQELDDFVDYYEAFHVLVSGSEEVRAAVSRAWLEGLEAHNGEKGVLLLRLRRPPGEQLARCPRLSDIAGELAFVTLDELLAEALDVDNATVLRLCVQPPARRYFHVVFSTPTRQLLTRARRMWLAPGLGDVGIAESFGASNPVAATPERWAQLAELVRRDEYVTKKTRVRRCMAGGCGAVEGSTDASGSAVKISSCSRCNKAWYCSRACQAEHWKSGHKAECKRNSP